MNIQEEIKKLESEFSAKVEELKKLAVKEEEFKVGDWVKIVSDNGCYTRHKIGDITQIIALTTQGEDKCVHNKILPDWSFGAIGCDDIIHATPGEIESHLIKEAEKKGFVKGAKVVVKNGVEKSVYDSRKETWVTSDSRNEREILDFILKDNELLFKLSIALEGVLYKSEILTLASTFPQIEINGYKAEFFEKHVQFGCATIASKIFIELSHLSLLTGVGNRNIRSVKIGDGVFSSDDIKQIAEHFQGGKP
jgi:hypothetical protein